MTESVGEYVDALLELHKTLPLEIWGMIVAYSAWTLGAIEEMCVARPETLGKLCVGGYIWHVLRQIRFGNDGITYLDGFPYRHENSERDAYFLVKTETFWKYWSIHEVFKHRESRLIVAIVDRRISICGHSRRNLDVFTSIFNPFSVDIELPTPWLLRRTYKWDTNKQLFQLLYYMVSLGMEKTTIKYGG